MNGIDFVIVLAELIIVACIISKLLLYLLKTKIFNLFLIHFEIFWQS